MELKGERLLAVDRDTAWQALNDPDRLRAAIPGCESIEPIGDNAYRVVVNASLGPVRAKFGGKLTVEDVVKPERYRLRFDGDAGAAGFVRGAADVALQDAEGGTRVAYGVNAQVGGRLAQVGNRLIDGAALKLADDFFAAFAAQLAPAAAHAPSALEEIESSVVLHDPRTWNWIGWTVALLVVVALALLLWR